MPKEAHKDTVLTTAAKAIGKAAGKVARAAGVEGERATSAPKGKLLKKNKSRLPRKQKKAQRKAAKSAQSE